ncbi:flagellin [Sporosarcina saromensis]|uniref:Flagellin n=1 Tax=Sporosarcina saromensis TaxID=359365 RepID=A0ABU4G6J1_9BACL|nr:flagellin [Sporosarcina saromensis]MDW0112602.1 flagellin [Sporosarcina saromensis]
MRINHNIAALNTHRQLGANNTQASKNLEKLSSGLKINRAGDDAAGLAISEKMRGQIRGLDMASKNAQDGISLIQTAEGALNETHSILQRMRELAVQSSNDTNNNSDRSELQKELHQLSQEITRIADNTEFNTKNLLGKNGFEGKFHIGANEGQAIDLKINNMDAESLKVIGYTGAKVDLNNNAAIEVSSNLSTAVEINFTAAKTGNNDAAVKETTATVGADGKITVTLAQAAGTGAAAGAITATQQDVLDALNKTGIVTATQKGAGDLSTAAAVGAAATTATAGTIDEDKGINISTQSNASDAIKTINNAIETVSAERSKLGATQNRLEHTINNLGTSSENLTAAESRIRDVDYVLAAA